MNIEEIRNKKYGGSMKQSEYNLLLRLSKELKQSQVETILQGLALLEKKVIAKRAKEQTLFTKKE
jgi:hypothetical protein